MRSRPLCGKSLYRQLVNDLWYCSDCDLAARAEECMPLQSRLIYTREWVKAEEMEFLTQARVNFASEQIKKLPGVHRILDVGCGG
jgi:hypothetical protein